MSRSRAFREVSGPRAPPRLVVSGTMADRLGVNPTTLVTVTATGQPGAASAADGAATPHRTSAPDGAGPRRSASPAAADDTAAGEAAGWAQTPRALPDIPAHRGPSEQNKALVNDVLASRSLLHLMGAAPGERLALVAMHRS